MQIGRGYKCLIIFPITILVLMVMQPDRVAHSQTTVRVAQIPGINQGPCNPGPEEKPWLNPNQTPGCRALEVIVTMKLDRDSFAAWDSDSHAWRVYPGTYSVMVGSSSRDIRLKGSFTIPSKQNL
jgi:hypothetical protein